MCSGRETASRRLCGGGGKLLPASSVGKGERPLAVGAVEGGKCFLPPWFGGGRDGLLPLVRWKGEWPLVIDAVEGGKTTSYCLCGGGGTGYWPWCSGGE